MFSAILAANLICGVQLYLQPQQSVKTVRWPTHGVATLPKGWVKPTEHFVLLENGQPINAQFEIAAKWPDGSPKWSGFATVFPAGLATPSSTAAPNKDLSHLARLRCYSTKSQFMAEPLSLKMFPRDWSRHRSGVRQLMSCF